MKRSLLLAISALALTATSQQLIAAESETAAPQERAAPAAERQRAAPARQLQRAPAQRQAASQSQTSSFTGSQAGGFGGGNAGGGGFADPSWCGHGVVSTPGAPAFSPLCGTTTQNIGKSTGALGGAEFGQMFPIGGYWAAGWAVDAQGSTLRSGNSQQTTRIVPVSVAQPVGAIINEGMNTSQTQPFGSTLRLKLGVVAMPGAMIFVTGGGAGGMVHGDFSYQAVSNHNPGALGMAFGSNSYDKWRFGYTAGGGVTFAFPGSPVGITLEYLYTDLGTVDQTILLASNYTNGSSSTGFATTSMKTQTSALRLKFSMGL